MKPLLFQKNFSIFPLPPYSPELNPMEQVWQKLKHETLAIEFLKILKKL
jgi:transposase